MRRLICVATHQQAQAQAKMFKGDIFLADPPDAGEVLRGYPRYQNAVVYTTDELVALNIAYLCNVGYPVFDNGIWVVRTHKTDVEVVAKLIRALNLQVEDHRTAQHEVE